MSYPYGNMQFPTRIIYVFATAVAFLFIIALVWFTLYAAILPLGASLTTIAEAMHTDTWPLYNTLTQVVSFMEYFWQLLLVFAVFGLAYWVWIYTQRRGRVIA